MITQLISHRGESAGFYLPSYHEPAMDSKKILQATETCLSGALQTNRPFSHVKHFLDALREDASWTEDEIAKVQSQVIRALMQRTETSQFGVQSSPSNAGC